MKPGHGESPLEPFLGQGLEVGGAKTMRDGFWVAFGRGEKPWKKNTSNLDADPRKRELFYML